MTSTPAPKSPSHPLPLTDEQTARLLELASTRAMRPVDELIERLTVDDGAEWFGRAIASDPLRRNGSSDEQLLHGRSSVEALLALKEDCKLEAYRSNDPECRNVAMLGYSLAVAAALVHHHTLISNRSRIELRPILEDLATVLPEPWAQFVAAAARACPTCPPSD